MGAQLLGERKTRRVAAATGLDVVRVWAHGGQHVQFFATRGHEHGWYDPGTGAWGWEENLTAHYESCPPDPEPSWTRSAAGG